MKILILGGGGMVGQKLLQRLAGTELNGVQNGEKISEVILHDIVPANSVDSPFKVTVLTGNLAEQAEAEKLASFKPDLIFHLASIVSGEAETNFEKGWDVNARGAWHLLEALRTLHEQSETQYVPKMVFTSSIAVFGPPFPEAIGDEFLCAPQTSYGAQKTMIELLISDYSRKGMIDGLSIRLPTICVRPGKPNLAASSFFSGIIREPLNGQEAILPVPTDVRHWHASPRAAAKFLTHAATIDLSLLKGRRSLNLPGVSCTVEEQIEALRSIAGEKTASLIRPKADSAIMKIVEGWPRNFNPVRAIELGFEAENNFKEIIETYLEDDFKA